MSTWKQPKAVDSICRVVTRIADSALRAHSLMELGACVHEQLKSLMPVSHIFMAIRGGDEYIEFPYWADGKDPAPSIKNFENGITEYILRTGQPLFADEALLGQMEREGRFSVLGTRPRQWFGVPLRSRNGTPIGVLAVQAYEDDPPLESQHGRILLDLAPAISIAVIAHRADTVDRVGEKLLNAAAGSAHIMLSEAGWQKTIDRALRLIGEAADASRAYVFRVERMPNGRYLATQTNEWVKSGVIPQIDNPVLQNLDLVESGFGRWVDALLRGETISGPISVFPEAERAILEPQDIRSLHIAPIHDEGRWWGFVGLDDCVRARLWPRAEREALRLFAKIIAQAVYLDRAQQQFALQNTALASAANGILIADAQGRILWVNDALLRMSGYERHEVLCNTPALFSSGKHERAFFQEMWETILRGAVWQGEIVNRRKNGDLYTVAMTITPVRGADGKPTHFIAIKQDITERKKLEHQLLLAQKMESIGRLAGGIAHDFNNIIQAIIGFSSILLSELHESDPLRSDVLEIERAAQHAAGLTRRLLMFSRSHRMDMNSLQVNDVVRGAAKMLRRLLPANIAIDIQLADPLPPVRGDAGQLEQALVNLAINARDAMPEGGCLCIRTAAEEIAQDRLPPAEGARHGQFILLEIEDTGSGMSQEVLDRIFEPFFTTKDPSRGTGLGLPVVYGIVRQHNGFIRVASTPGKGSRFSIYLPVDASVRAPMTPARGAAEYEGPFPGNGEHILVLEDEEAVRDLAVRVLANSNYRVTAARDVAEAKKLLAQPNASFDLLFSDVVLPDGNGLDLGEQVKREHPNTKVVLTSGYTREREHWNERIARLDGYLSKPYPPPLLLRLVRRVLDGSAL